MKGELKTEPDDKLYWLRRLDPQHEWAFLDEERHCLRSRRTFSGRQARLIGGTPAARDIAFLLPDTGLRIYSGPVD